MKQNKATLFTRKRSISHIFLLVMTTQPRNIIYLIHEIPKAGQNTYIYAYFVDLTIPSYLPLSSSSHPTCLPQTIHHHFKKLFQTYQKPSNIFFKTKSVLNSQKMIMNRDTRFCLVLFCLVWFCAIPSSGDDDTAPSRSLLKFKESLTNVAMLSDWKEPVANVCSPLWTGCACTNGVLTGLRLEGMGLSGTIDIESLSNLATFNKLSVMNNSFSGPFPSDLNKLRNLRSLHLANNKFNGEIPDTAFSGMKGMRRVVLGNNEFTGNIPLSLLQLPKLVDLQLQNNQFGGQIPDLWQEYLTINFSYNKLEGSIPATLRSQNASSFYGNELCGMPLDTCNRKKLTWKLGLIIAVAVGLALAAVIMLFLILHKRVKPLRHQKSVEKPHKEDPISSQSRTFKSSEHGKLQFVRNDRQKFELEELLRASAEVLGSGSFGSSYKAMLFSGQSYVVRRFKQMSNVGKEEFQEHMRKLGMLSHPNLLPLVAFYHRKDEKLLITDFAENGSLASLLHSKRSPDQPGLDWPTRLRLIKGISRGLTYLYEELPTLNLPHGHLKSSNVLLNSTFEPLLADYALVPVINKDHAQKYMVAYKSPESSQNGCVTRKTDVWSLGILILELLTGKFPANYLKQGKGPSADLATWVNSVVREEWTVEVFDKDMNLARRAEGQMLQLLRIGMCCCEWDVDKRWDMKEAIEKIEELKEKDSDDDFSSYASEADIYSSRTMTDDDFSFSKA